MCFGCSKEPSQRERDLSFEYPQYMFWLRNKKNNYLLHTLIRGPEKSMQKFPCMRRVTGQAYPPSASMAITGLPELGLSLEALSAIFAM